METKVPLLPVIVAAMIYAGGLVFLSIYVAQSFWTVAVQEAGWTAEMLEALL